MSHSFVVEKPSSSCNSSYLEEESGEDLTPSWVRKSIQWEPDSALLLEDTFTTTEGTSIDSSFEQMGKIIGDEEDFEIVPRSSGSPDEILEKIFGDLHKGSAAKQFAVGGISGWVSGYLTLKVGKAVAATFTGSLILIQLAQYQGYITVDWTKVHRVMDRARISAQRNVSKKRDLYFRIREFYEENFFLTLGFTGGLGIALFLS